MQSWEGLFIWAELPMYDVLLDPIYNIEVDGTLHTPYKNNFDVYWYMHMLVYSQVSKSSNFDVTYIKLNLITCFTYYNS